MVDVFSQRLRELREKLNIEQQDMAIRIGCSASAYSLYEGGKRRPSFETLNKIADILDCTIDYLFGRVDNPHYIKKDLPPTKSGEQVSVVIDTRHPETKDTDILDRRIEQVVERVLRERESRNQD